jgi:hypothetical protein
MFGFTGTARLWPLTAVLVVAQCGGRAREAGPPAGAGADGPRIATPDGSAGSRPDSGRSDGAGPAGTGGASAGEEDAGPETASADSQPPAQLGDQLPPCRRTVAVEDLGELAAANTGAMPGDCILLADGDYPAPTMPIVITAKGTSTAPVVIRAANPRGANIIGGSRLTNLDDTGGLRLVGASYVIVAELSFPGYSPLNIVDSDHCRVTRSKFVQGGARATGTSDSTRIDHNDFGPKSTLGHEAQATGLSTNTRIDHNHFHDVSPGDNGRDTVTLGCCGPMFDYHDTGNVLEYNLFVNCRGEAELISIKSSSNVVRYNTIRGSSGTVTLRAGNKNSIHGNFIFGSSGIRMYEDDHKIYNNYVEVGTALQGNGSGAGHAVVRRAIIVHNTFVGSVSLSGTGNVFSDNIVTGGMGVGGAMAVGNLSGAGAGLVRMGEIMTITPMSKAVDAAMATFPFVTEDLQGQPRDKPDVGADELSTAPEMALRRPLTEADVGISAP